MPIMEVDEDIFNTITASGKPAGEFESTKGNDLWKWTGTPFPSSGFSLNAQNNGTVDNPTQVFKSYAFDTTPQVPSSLWGGQIFTIKRNGTLIGWLEAKVTGSNAQLMWWSNGSDLTSGNVIKLVAGDVLAFDPGSLPSSQQLPLSHTQP